MDYVSLKYLFLSAIISILIAEICCQNLEPDAECQLANGKKNLTLEDALAEPLLEFSAKSFRAINNGTKNIVISPVAIHSAMNIVLLGTGENSQTRNELLHVLGYDGNECIADKAHNFYAELMENFRKISAIAKSQQQQQVDSQQDVWSVHGDQPKGPKLDIWNVAFAHNADPKPTYLKRISQYYNCTMNKFDENNQTKMIDMIGKLNKWGEEAGFDADLVTFDEIKPKSGDPTVVLLNAVQVEAYWLEVFYEQMRDNAFYNFGDHKQPVQYSISLDQSDIKNGKFVEFTRGLSVYREHNEAVAAKNPRSYSDLAPLEFRAISIPLQGNMSYTILEPLRNGIGNELRELEKNLLSDSSRLRKTIEVLDSAEAKIDHIQMPPFKYSNNIDLISLLKSIGLSEVFTNQSNLSQMLSKGAKIGKAKHQALIEVNKKGLKGAAVTKIRIALHSAHIKPNPIRLKIEHPFIFVVRYGKIPMFIGHLVHL